MGEQRREDRSHHGERVERAKQLHPAVRMREHQLPLLQPSHVHRGHRPVSLTIKTTSTPKKFNKSQEDSRQCNHPFFKCHYAMLRVEISVSVSSTRAQNPKVAFEKAAYAICPCSFNRHILGQIVQEYRS